MKSIYALLAAVLIGSALGKPGGGSGEKKGSGEKDGGYGKKMKWKRPESEEEVFMGFDAMPDGCPKAMDDAIKCKKEQYEAVANFERRWMELRMECYEEKKCRKMDLTEDMMKEDFNPNPIAAEIGGCLEPVTQKLWMDMVGKCLGGPGWKFPIYDDEKMMKEPELALDVMYKKADGKGARRKRSPEKLKRMMMKMGHGNDSMDDMKDNMMKLAKYKKMKEGMEALEDSWGTMDYLYDCREPGQMRKNYEKRYEVNKCLWEKVQEEGLAKKRAEAAMKAGECMMKLPTECARAYRFRALNWCKCAQVFHYAPAVDAAVGVCVPSIYHEYVKKEVMGNLLEDIKENMCEKKMRKDEFDLDEYFEKVEKMNEYLMKAIMKGEVDMSEFMEKSMEAAMEMMEDKGGKKKMMYKMMEEMMDDDDAEEMMKKGYRKMEMLGMMDEEMMKHGKSKAQMMPYKKMMKMKKMMMYGKGKGKGYGDGDCPNYPAYPPMQGYPMPPPPPPPMPYPMPYPMPHKGKGRCRPKHHKSKSYGHED